MRATEKSRTQGMRQMEGGIFLMGSDRFYPEERPARKVQQGDDFAVHGAASSAARAAMRQGRQRVAVAES